jgi:hypothetical protein
MAGHVHLRAHYGRGVDHNIFVDATVSDVSMQPHHNPAEEDRSQVVE